MPKVKNTTFSFIYELFFPDPETGGKKIVVELILKKHLI